MKLFIWLAVYAYSILYSSSSIQFQGIIFSRPQTSFRMSTPLLNNHSAFTVSETIFDPEKDLSTLAPQTWKFNEADDHHNKNEHLPRFFANESSIAAEAMPHKPNTMIDPTCFKFDGFYHSTQKYGVLSFKNHYFSTNSTVIICNNQLCRWHYDHGTTKSIAMRLNHDDIEVLEILDIDNNKQKSFRLGYRPQTGETLINDVNPLTILLKKITFLRGNNALALATDGSLYFCSTHFSNFKKQYFNNLSFVDIATNVSNPGEFIALTSDNKLIYVNLCKQTFTFGEGQLNRHTIEPTKTYKVLQVLSKPDPAFVRKIWFNKNKIMIYEGETDYSYGIFNTYNFEHIIHTLPLYKMCEIAWGYRKLKNSWEYYKNQ